VSNRQAALVFIMWALCLWATLATLHKLFSKPMDAQEYADKLCQELYGPQTGATWEKGRLMCETVRGEIIEVRRVK
jgi:hypothetical protein